MSSSTPSGFRRLGLDDPNVSICFDRGDNFDTRTDRLQQSVSSDIASSSANGSPIVQCVRKILEDGIIICPPDSSLKFFIPRDLLSKTMTFSTVHSVINTLPCCSTRSLADKKKLAREVSFGDGRKDRGPCWKLLAVLILRKLQDDLVKLIENGVDDNCLPLGSNLKCRNTDHNHNDMYGKIESLEFSRYTYVVMAPYFTKPRDKHIHYIFDPNDILPILQVENPNPSEAPPPGVKPAVTLMYGGFSHVQCVQFHPSHFHFDSKDFPDGEKRFALKKLNSTKREDFNKELASLLSCQIENNKHLIKLLFTFEIKGTQGTDSSKFSLVFPWADGNLWRFWRIHQSPSAREPRGLWMAEQCYQLVCALTHVHNERDLNLKDFPDIDENNRELYGRHGDVKAENILWFRNKDVLVMADFGLGRLHSRISASNDTKSMERTATYRAPEFDTKDGKISRACDIYSMGCTFLEFVTWQLEGWESVHDIFPQQRLERDHYKFDSDSFFKIQNYAEETETAIRKEKVTEWIKRLKQNPRCTQYHIDFLELINSKMLEPNKESRIKCISLKKKLGVFVRTCKDDPSYYEPPNPIKAQQNGYPDREGCLPHP